MVVEDWNRIKIKELKVKMFDHDNILHGRRVSINWRGKCKVFNEMKNYTKNIRISLISLE